MFLLTTLILHFFFHLMVVVSWVVEMKFGSTSKIKYNIKDSKLTSSQSTNHNTTGTETCFKNENRRRANVVSKVVNRRE